jgi:hypothetical protein
LLPILILIRSQIVEIGLSLAKNNITG